MNNHCKKYEPFGKKFTFKAKGECGKHVAGGPPYGYLKDSEDKNKWVMDAKIMH